MKNVNQYIRTTNIIPILIWEQQNTKKKKLKKNIKLKTNNATNMIYEGSHLSRNEKQGVICNLQEHLLI